MLNLGVQVSIAGKIYNAVDRAERLGCSTLQIFARNPRQFRKGSLKKEDIDIFCRRVKEAKLWPVVIHTPYTLNLAARKSFLFHISIKEFIQDIKEAHRLEADYIVIHAGSFRGNEDDGLERIVYALDVVLKNTLKFKPVILIENTAGDGSNLGYTVEQWGVIFRKLKFPRRLGICLDTAHAWAAGYRLNTARGLSSFLEEVEKEVGVKRIKVIHLNDTSCEMGSRRDRHFHIGKGKIGEKGIRLIINHPQLRKLPFILETPKKTESDDARNLNTVRRLYRG